MKLKNAMAAGLISVSAVAGLVSPAYASARPAAAKVDKCSGYKTGATCATNFVPE
jgi:hypothetical protein